MIRAWIATGDELRTAGAEEAARAAAEGRGQVWIDFSDEPEHGADAVLTQLQIHPLVREDMVTQINRPKVDNYGAYIYLVLHTARWDADKPLLREIDFVLGERFLITYHDGKPRALEAAYSICERRPDVLRDGPVHLLHFILDTLVDQYLPIMDKIADELDALEERILEAHGRTANRKILMLKRGMSALRRVVGPQRDTVLALTRDEFHPIPADMRPYLRDVYDRMARVSDLLDSFRDEVSSLLELHVSVVSIRLNEVIKRLTIIATIGLPLTLVTSWYGMNFAFAEYKFRHPLAYVVSVCVATALVTWWLLKRNRWV